MSYINKELYEKASSQSLAVTINSSISQTLRSDEVSSYNAFPLIPYLLHKVSLYGDPAAFSYQSIVDGKLDISEDIRQLAKDVLNEDVWNNRLLPMTWNYSAEDFALAAVHPITDSEAMGTVVTPSSIIKLVNRLLDVNEGEDIAAVCCGCGSYIMPVALEQPGASYFGYELNESNKIHTRMKAELMDIETEFDLEDVFTVAQMDPVPKYDKIFANYPFGSRLKNFGAGAAYLEYFSEQHPLLPKGTSPDWIFVSMLCDMLKENGKAAVIVTSNSTSNNTDIPVRQYFVEHQLVECVISLPGKLFSSTSISTALLILSHNNDTVRMIDASNQYQTGRRQNELRANNIEAILDGLTADSNNSKTISLEELRSNEYSLNLARYIPDDTEAPTGVPFESVIKSISRGFPFPARQLDQMITEHPTDTRYIALANIQNGLIDDNLPHLLPIDPRYDRFFLRDKTLILSKNGFPYKVAVASIANGERVLVNENLYMIELDEEKANPYYIKAFLDSQQGHALLKSISTGSSIPYIGVEKLKKLHLPLPSIEEQNQTAQKYKEILDEITTIKLHLKTTIDKLHHILDEQNE